ncbi:hypothetical protein MUK42_16531 [Musa troglodytarum]|uniref:Uncharacterized protein n=1 Tax=Musa troglodytarum TaxID=320322 RepID=A0A9E7GLI8_9LILI|nr:hypothetical protein MUK42_16531 [Musa troglodytarum]
MGEGVVKGVAALVCFVRGKVCGRNSVSIIVLPERGVSSPAAQVATAEEEDANGATNASVRHTREEEEEEELSILFDMLGVAIVTEARPEKISDTRQQMWMVPFSVINRVKWWEATTTTTTTAYYYYSLGMDALLQPPGEGETAVDEEEEEVGSPEN